MNDTRRGNHNSFPTLFDALNVPNVLPADRTPEPSDVICALREWLRAVAQYGQWEMIVCAARRVPFGDIHRQ